MMIRTLRLTLLGLASSTLLLGACVPPKIMFARTFIPDKTTNTAEKVASFSVQENSALTTSSGDAHYDLRLQVCNQANSGADQSCAESLLLEDVQLYDSTY